MMKLNLFFRKYKWVLITVFLLAGGAFWLNNMFSRDSKRLEGYTFATFIAREYMIDLRHSAKKWPTDLSELPTYVKSGHRISSLQGMKDLALQYSRDRSLKLEVIQVCPDNYVYRIYTESFAITCQSTINPDYGNCFVHSK